MIYKFETTSRAVAAGTSSLAIKSYEGEFEDYFCKPKNVEAFNFNIMFVEEKAGFSF